MLFQVFQPYLIPLILILSGYLLLTSWNKARKTPAIPKIRGWLPGNLDILWKLAYYDSHEYCGETLREWSEKYGPTYDLNILWAHQIVTVDPENVKHILVTDFDSFGKGSSFHQMLEPFLGNGIFAVDGDEWRTRRALAKPFFSNEHLFRDEHLEMLESHISKAMDIISLHAQRKESLDIQNLFSRMTFDIGMNFLFGDRISSKHDGYSLFAEAFNRVSKISTRRIRIGSNWRLFEFGCDPMEQPMKDINLFIEPLIQDAMSESASGMSEDSFLKYLLAAHKDPKDVKDELMNFLLAIRDTTASFLTFATYILASSPEITANLQDEIANVMDEREVITSGDIQHMPYLRSVLNEVLRLFPPVSFNIRRCLRDSILPSPLSQTGPFPIKMGTSVTYVPLIIQRRRDLWGDDAESFHPSRWSADSPKASSLHLFAFHPFNGGPRLCLGQQYAYIQCSYFIIRLLKAFDRVTADSPFLPSNILQRKELKELHKTPCWPAASLTLYCKGGLWIRGEPKDRLV